MKRKKLPNEKNVKTEWDLTPLYKSLHDPQIEEDMQEIERTCERFADTYRGDEIYLVDATALKDALRAYEDILELGCNPLFYTHLVLSLNSGDEKAKALQKQLEARLQKIQIQLSFFTLKLGKIPEEKQKEFVLNEQLQQYHYMLERTFKNAQHKLSEAEEKILTLKNIPAYSMWVQGMKTSKDKLTILLDGEELPIAKAESLAIRTEDAKKRRKLSGAVMDAYYRISDFAESEINAVLTNKKIDDELRGFKKPHDATVLAYENDPRAVDDLVSTVTDNFDLGRRFFTAKKKMLGLEVMFNTDREASPEGSVRSFPLEHSVGIVRDALARAGKRYVEMFDRFALDGQIDFYPKQGKTGGGFCIGNRNAPTFLLLNDDEKASSVITMGHEMGHGIHTERMKEAQSPVYQSYSMAVAETASTFFEALTIERLAEDLSTDEWKIILHDKIQRDVGTIFRQIAFFNFELELHRAVREKGWVPKEEIAGMLNRHLHAYMGDAVEIPEKDGYFFVCVPHFRMPFYVYSYTYGQLISKALLQRFRADASYIEKVDEFLCAGNSKSPEQIFADIGINVGKQLFEEGIASIDADIAELERLAS